MSVRGVHLVGSFPFKNRNEVFDLAVTKLSKHLKRLSDGESGERAKRWVNWQLDPIKAAKHIKEFPPDPNEPVPNPHYGVADGAKPTDVVFPPLGYAHEAKTSYVEFKRRKSTGEIPAHIKFLVCLPTPLGVITAAIEPGHQVGLEPIYEKAMFAEVDAIAAAIPHDQLAIQWDAAVETVICEKVFPPHYDDILSGTAARLARYCNYIPHDIEVGYHLCYGDNDHAHFMEPKDTGVMVGLINAVHPLLTRPLHFIHLPVPRDRNDDAYFVPLDHIKLRPETELYLGLVHFTDGEAGTRKRIEAAKKHVANFGVATECGLGRRKPETIPRLFDVHTAVAEPVKSA